MVGNNLQNKIIFLCAVLIFSVFIYPYAASFGSIIEEGKSSKGVLIANGLLPDPAYPSDNNIVSYGKNILQNPGDKQKSAQYTRPEYVPGEILVKFKEGVVPQVVLTRAQVQVRSVQRLCEILSCVAKFKKSYKLERDSDGWFPFLGKKYKEVSEISDEEMFKKAYLSLPDQEKGVYRIYKISLAKNADNIQQALDALRGNHDIEYAEPNYILKAMAAPNDPYYASAGSWGQNYADLWNLKKVKTEEGWDYFATEEKKGYEAAGDNVVIAVVDTGVDYTHPDLAGNIWINQDEAADNCLDDDHNGFIDDVHGWNFADNNDDPIDRYGHGSHVAGTIAAIANNGIGVAGVAPRAKIMALKGLDDTGSGSTDRLSQCVKYAADNGADVINNSWGGRNNSQTLVDIFAYAHAKGAVCVAAAGNDTTDLARYSPAGISSVITVSATTQDDTLCSFSNFGLLVDVASPGGGYENEPANGGYGKYNILSTLPDSARIIRPYPALKVSSGYARIAGTSMACPLVSGVAGLIISYNKALHRPTISPEEVRQVIRLTADPLTDPLNSGKDLGPVNQLVGSGRVNVLKALEMLKNVTTIPQVKITSPDRLANVVRDHIVNIRGYVKGEGIAADQIKIEYAFFYSSLSGFIVSRDSAIAWTELAQDNISYNSSTGEVSANLEVPTSLVKNVIALRLSVPTAYGTACDVSMLQYDYLDLFRIVEPDVSAYGHAKDFIVGQSGPVNCALYVPAIDYAGRGINVSAELKILDATIMQKPVVAQLGAIANPQEGNWDVLFDTTRYPDRLYDIVWDISLSCAGRTLTRRIAFSDYTAVPYHSNNTKITAPFHGSVYGQDNFGPVNISGYSVMPVLRIEAAAGAATQNWIPLPFSVSGQDGNFGFSAVLDLNQLDLSHETLVSIRVINDIEGQAVENDRIAIIADREIAQGWPARYEKYGGTYKFALGDVTGDGKDEAVILTDSGGYAWTPRDLYEKRTMQIESRCHIFSQGGRLDRAAGDNSQRILQQDMDSDIANQVILDLALSDLDGVTGKEIIASVLKQSNFSFYQNKWEVMPLTREGGYPAKWTRFTNSECSFWRVQTIHPLDVNADGKKEIFFQNLEIRPEDITYLSCRKNLGLIDNEGRLLLEKEAPFGEQRLSFYLETDIFGNLERNGQPLIFKNFNRLEPYLAFKRTRQYPVLLDANSLSVKQEIMVPHAAADQNEYFATAKAADITGDEGFEFLFLSGVRETHGNVSGPVYKLYAYNPDGTAVSSPDWPYAPADQDWGVSDFAPVDFNQDGKAEILALDGIGRLNLLNGNGRAIWSAPVNLPSPFGFVPYPLKGVVVLNGNDNSPAQIILPARSAQGRFYLDGLGSFYFSGLGEWLYSPILFIDAASGAISRIKYLPSCGDIALGDMDGSGKVQLIAGYCNPDVNMTQEHQPGIYPEVAVFNLSLPYDPERSPWNQTSANAMKNNVYGANHRPVMAVLSDQTVALGETASFVVSATDQDGDNLFYSASGLPEGASFDATSRSFSWTPAASQLGSHRVSFGATDGELSGTQSLTITVLPQRIISNICQAIAEHNTNLTTPVEQVIQDFNLDNSYYIDGTDVAICRDIQTVTDSVFLVAFTKLMHAVNERMGLRADSPAFITAFDVDGNGTIESSDRDAIYAALSVGRSPDLLSQTPAPVMGISGVSPTTVGVGQTITIAGFGFGATQRMSRVFLNNNALEVVSWSNPQIICRIGAGATSGAMHVVTPWEKSSATEITIISKPNAPSKLTATALSGRRIKLVWKDNSDNESGFKIERSYDGINFSQVAVVGPNVTTYTNFGLSAGRPYCYRVRAYNAAGNSASSNIAWARARY